MSVVLTSELTSDALKVLAKYHAAAVGADGVMALTVIDTANHVRPQKFAIGDAQIMADEAMARGQDANAYFGPAVMRSDIAKRGTKQDIVAVAGVVIDADADTGKHV